MVLYLKITNKEENHYGFQYQDGLNILTEPFNNDPNASCVPGGFYFTTSEFIHHFYHYGIYLRVVDFPFDDPNFQMLKDGSIGIHQKWRSNQIIFKEKYSLDDVGTYTRFGIPFPELKTAVEQHLTNIVKYIINDPNYHDVSLNYALSRATELGFLDTVQVLVAAGAKIEYNDFTSMKMAVIFGHVDVVKYLCEKEPKKYTPKYNEMFIRSIQCKKYEVAKFFIESGKISQHHKDHALARIAKYGDLDILRCLVDHGAKININLHKIQPNVKEYLRELVTNIV